METENKNLVARYIEEIVNSGEVERITNFISPDYTEVFNNQRYVLGIEGAVDHIKGVRNTYPDLILTVDMQLAEGDWVVTCYTMRGTHMGEWMGIKPTGKRLETIGVNLDKVINGKIVEHGGAVNLFTSLLSVGAIRVVDE
ncbi:MAG: ester cyclase [Bacteroidetes bacterium]|nr:ester cyclase [Bacteroidota bacterium]